jgi:Ser/Thr protein kinase RdoA (MazF antagonist)
MSNQSSEYSEEVLGELEEMCRSAIAGYGFSSGSSLKLLNISENATFLVEDSEVQRKSILRVHRVGYHTLEAIHSELGWIEALQAEQIVEVATPVRTLDGGLVQTLVSSRGRANRYAVMFDFLEGEEPEPEDNLGPWFERLGETTARLHLFTANWKRPENFVRHIWDCEAMFGERNLWGPWQKSMGLSPDGEAVLAKAIERIRQDTGRYGQSVDRFGLIHADLRLANLLIDKNKLKVIDFDDCGFSWFMYDFAAAVSFFEDHETIPDLLTAWLGGYERIRPLTASDRAIVPTLVIARRILLTAWLASHNEIPLAKALGTRFTDVSVQLAERFLAGKFLTDVVP